MVQVKHIVIASAALLICGGVGSVAYMKFRSENTNRAIINRSDPMVLAFLEPENYMLPIDRTTFTVSKKVSLNRIDIPHISSHSTGDLSDQNANVTVWEKDDFKSADNQTICIRMFNATLSSAHESVIEILPAIPLIPKKVYEIQVEIPHNDTFSFMYKGYHEIKEYRIKRSFFRRSIVVKFYQNNTQTEPIDVKRQLTQGVIQRFYLEY